MATNLTRAKADVDAAAARVDRALADLGGESKGLKRSLRSVSPQAVLGVALVAGFLFVILPRRWRGVAFAGLGRFALGRVLDAFTARGA
ncbi:hypothetical protein [Tahibacter soli]|jgi:hypothetical protein|uniref:Uncharacterized protein n=1 Tax=Tahibacter soli TaxID=2983605 RepID=A0A9X3YNV2_9GAMM|nr:hypothetical protein [Tahibacter soli]MDC8015107.1 hypothetical protein [Tahibacter soli]